MRTCYRCKQTKPLEEFVKNAKRRDGRSGECKDCKRTLNREYYRKTPERNPQRNESRLKSRRVAQDFIRGYLQENSCVDCGVSDWRVLEFDHVRGEKLHEVSKMVRDGFGISLIQDEIVKCDVRCANCHRVVTFERASSWRSSASSSTGRASDS